jgi:cytochrome c-type biogenesis protein CcmH/NrfG
MACYGDSFIIIIIIIIIIASVGSRDMYNIYCLMLNHIFSEREREIKVLGQRLKEMQRNNADLLKELGELTKRETRLQEDMECEKEAESIMEQQLYNLWMVPTMFYISSEVEQDSSEVIPVFICLTDGS